MEDLPASVTFKKRVQSRQRQVVYCYLKAAPHLAAQKAVEHHRELVRCVVDRNLDCVAWIGPASCRQPVQLRPYNRGAVALRNELVDKVLGYGGWVRSSEPPRLPLLAFVQVPNCAGNSPTDQRDHGEPAALGQRGSLKAEAEPAEVHPGSSFPGVATAEAHCRDEILLPHPMAIVDDCNRWLRMDRKPNSHVLSVRRDAVVNQVSKSCRCRVAHRPQGLHKKGRDRRQLNAGSRGHTVHSVCQFLPSVVAGRL